jgi:hypothetical protein
MDSAWQALPAALADAWREACARREWCESACALARRTVLGDGPFTVELDATAPEDATEIATQALHECGAATQFDRITGMGPGLRIRRGLACVDATVPGLLASRERIEAELLAEVGALIEDQGRSSA